jgi:predicted MFS family arabinose efflux permease
MRSRYRWFVAFVLFLFLLLHQADKLLIGPLTTSIIDDFGINEAQMGAVSSLAIVVASLLYPVWG